MNVLCSDKTGTLTEGVVQLNSALDMRGRASDQVLRLAYLNASFETGFTNPIDEAIRDSVKHGSEPTTVALRDASAARSSTRSPTTSSASA